MGQSKGYKVIKLTSNKSSPIKSLVNLFKLVAIVAFINHELIYQQQVVAGRSRGLIYNKDGKFIYRPPKSSQGHIIVIDDRHRDSYRDDYAAVQPVATVAAAATSAETAYQPVRLISQRAYHPAGAHLAPPIRSYYTGEQGLLINLSNLQGVAQPILTAPGQAAAAAADPIPLTLPLARPRSAHSLRGSASAPLTSLPLLQFYRPMIAATSRPTSELTYSSYQPALTHHSHHHQHHQQQQQQQQQYPLYNQQTNQIEYGEPQSVQPIHQQQIDHHHQYAAIRDNGYAQQPPPQPPAGGTRIYDADTPIGAYELPIGLDQQSAGNPFFDDSLPPSPYNGAHMGGSMTSRHSELARHHHDPMKQLGSGHPMQDFDELINIHNHDPLVAADHSGSTNQVPAPKMRNYKSQADRSRDQALLLPLKRYKSGVEPPASSLGGPVASSRGLKKNSDPLKTKHLDKESHRDSIDSHGMGDPNGNDGSENHRYWRQFKDQFDIVQK